MMLEPEVTTSVPQRTNKPPPVSYKKKQKKKSQRLAPYRTEDLKHESDVASVGTQRADPVMTPQPRSRGGR